MKANKLQEWMSQIIKRQAQFASKRFKISRVGINHFIDPSKVKSDLRPTPHKNAWKDTQVCLLVNPEINNCNLHLKVGFGKLEGTTL